MIVYRDSEAFAIPEPRIRHIARDLQRLLALVQLESGGQPIEVDAFRLRHLPRWVSAQSTTAMNALTPISSVCNSKCDFCFEENVPYAREQSLMSVEEARTRLKYFDPESGACLFPSSRNHMETFVHPKALEIIELARMRQPDKLFWITTNGSHFTEEVVQRLARLKPLIFKLSLNVSDPQLNHALMHTGKRTEIALDAARLLQKYRIPFMGGIVAWPTIPLDALAETARYLERHQAYAIRVRLPLAHQWLKHQLDVDFDEHWRNVCAFAKALRPTLEVPLFVEPPIYWVSPLVPEVDGVVQNSPAWHAGVMAGDIVRRINGSVVRTRIESEALLDSSHLRGEREVDITIERAGTAIDLRLVQPCPADDTYPYCADHFYRGENYGIFHVEDFRLNHLQKAIDRISQRGARTVLLFTSLVVAPIVETIVANVPEFASALADVDVHLAVVDHHSFGGNYGVMDSRVVDDFRSTIRRKLELGLRPDLILIPNAFGSQWGIDVFGDSVQHLEIEFGIPIERIDWLLVYGREV